MRVKVEHMIAVLEELLPIAEKLDADADDGIGEEYGKHVGKTIEMLQDPEHFYHDDVLLEFV